LDHALRPLNLYRDTHASAGEGRLMVRAVATPETRSVRLLKVGEQVRHVISDLLTRQMVHDDVLSAHSVSVTEVRMSPDLRHATVFVKPLLGADEDLVLKALRTNTAFFQKEVAGKLRLKYAAKIRFQGDESFDEASRIDALLADPKVRRDLEE
jgi:ribosome-binding factor A